MCLKKENHQINKLKLGDWPDVQIAFKKGLKK